MNKILRVLVGLPAVLFIVSGISWIVDPASAASGLGMPLLEGVGRSTQVGDFAAFFLTAGSCILIALITGKRSWFYPPVLLLGLAAFIRVLAWLIHDAALAVDMIAVEAIIASLLLFASRRLASGE